MAEMLEASAILAGTSSRSLVIIDELGRGTSTFDGFGLAWAISEHLLQRTRAYALFATHFHELTALAAQSGGLAANRHVAVHCAPSGELTMLYHVREGACPSSFGIQAAQSTSFPPAVVAAARAKAAQLEALGGGATSIMMGSSGGGVGGGGSARETEPEPAEGDVDRARRFLTALAAEGPSFEALAPAAKRARMRQLLEAQGPAEASR